MTLSVAPESVRVAEVSASLLHWLRVNGMLFWVTPGLKVSVPEPVPESGE